MNALVEGNIHLVIQLIIKKLLCIKTT